MPGGVRGRGCEAPAYSILSMDGFRPISLSLPLALFCPLESAEIRCCPHKSTRGLVITQIFSGLESAIEVVFNDLLGSFRRRSHHYLNIILGK